MTAGLGRRLIWERVPHTGPLVGGLGVPSPLYFLVRDGAWSPGNQDKSTTHSSGLDDSDSTSYNLLLCVFLNVCVCLSMRPTSTGGCQLCTCARTCLHGSTSTCARAQAVIACTPVSQPKPSEYDDRQGRWQSYRKWPMCFLFKGTVLSTLHGVSCGIFAK